MAESSIKRVGVVVKPNQPEALATLCNLVRWLGDRGIALIGAPGLDRESISETTGCFVETSTPETLAATVDLMVVLGGDGTMIATSRMMGDYECAGGWNQLRDLWLSCGISQRRMFPALGRDFRRFLHRPAPCQASVELFRGEQLITHEPVLNDVVINQAALLELSRSKARFNRPIYYIVPRRWLDRLNPNGVDAYNL